jgi:hypothetical protein
MKYWACLNNHADQVALQNGDVTITNVAMAAHGAPTSDIVARLSCLDDALRDDPPRSPSAFESKDVIPFSLLKRCHMLRLIRSVWSACLNCSLWACIDPVYS